jgi:hypothetical protein
LKGRKEGTERLLPVLLLESKNPGTLQEKDRCRDLDSGHGILKNDRIIIGQLLRKYVVVTGIHLKVVYDSTALEEMKIDPEKSKRWRSRRRLPAKLSFENKAKRFLSWLIACTKTGMVMQELISE